MSPEKRLQARLNALYEVFDMSIARLSEDERQEFSEVLFHRSRAIRNVLGDPGTTFEEHADELQFLALLMRHHDKIAERITDHGITPFCIQCLKPPDSTVPFCFSCNSDRFLILTN